MSNRTKLAIGGVAVGLILLYWIPFWAFLLLVIGVPLGAYLALDSGQRRRLRRAGRRQIGR